MAAANYDACLKQLFVHEGGYSNHPSDPGGPTNFGITLADFRAYLQANATAADVKAMTVAQAAPIYRVHYWDALRCDDLPSGVDYALFDYGVNSGIGRAAKVIRRIIGAPSGSTIDATVIARIAMADAATLVKAICDERLAFLRSLKTWPVFGAGWGRRVTEVRAAALAMSTATSSSVANAATSTSKPAAATAIILAAGAAATQQTYGPASGVAAVAVIGAAALVLLALWIIWYRRRRRQIVSHSQDDTQQEIRNGVD